jgi:hypothetical protein
VLETELLFPSNLTQPQKLLLKGALFLPTKLDEAQVRAGGMDSGGSSDVAVLRLLLTKGCGKS